MQSTHIFKFAPSAEIDRSDLPPVNLVVTSPPYPMIEMWDNVFGELNPDITRKLSAGDGDAAFELMHVELDRVWEIVDSLLVQGGIVCINIGDATRKVDGLFQLFSSHSRIIRKFISMGYHCLPGIIWRKATNSPNKFMGSGMLPPNAYVTLEHEHILVFRKGGKRAFKNSEKKLRRQSSYFWEERNLWFSDLWEIRGTRQALDSATRERSAAYPFEIPYRLIQMYSLRGDWVLDPFVGTGTTSLAAAASARNSVGIDIADGMRETVLQRFEAGMDVVNHYNQDRLKRHLDFLKAFRASGKEHKHVHKLGFGVVTSQEKDLVIDQIDKIRISDSYEGLEVKVDHSKLTDLWQM